VNTAKPVRLLAYLVSNALPCVTSDVTTSRMACHRSRAPTDSDTPMSAITISPSVASAAHETATEASTLLHAACLSMINISTGIMGVAQGPDCRFAACADSETVINEDVAKLRWTLWQ